MKDIKEKCDMNKNQQFIISDRNNEKGNIEKECIFEAFEGGYLGPSYYYFVYKRKDKYYFKFDYALNGMLINNFYVLDYLNEIQYNSKFYEKMLTEINEIIENWQNRYDNNNIMDGIQWSLKIKNESKEYYGSNDFPSNYPELTNVLKKYFNSSIMIEELENDDGESF